MDAGPNAAFSQGTSRSDRTAQHLTERRPFGRGKIESRRTPSAGPTVSRTTRSPRLPASKVSVPASRSNNPLCIPRQFTHCHRHITRHDKNRPACPTANFSDSLLLGKSRIRSGPCEPAGTSVLSPVSLRCRRAGEEAALCTFRSECLSLSPQTTDYEHRLVRKRHFRTGSQPPAGPVARRQPAAAAR